MTITKTKPPISRIITGPRMPTAVLTTPSSSRSWFSAARSSISSSSPLVSPLATKCTSIGGNSLLAPRERAIGAPPRTATAASCHARRSPRVGDDLRRDAERLEHWNRARGEDRERAREAGGVVAARDAPDEREAQLEGVVAQPRRLVAQPAPEAPGRAGDHDQEQPPPGPQEIRCRDQDARQDRQRPVASLEDADDLRHDVAEQETHDAKTDDGEQYRVDHRVADLLLEHLA